MLFFSRCVVVFLLNWIDCWYFGWLLLIWWWFGGFVWVVFLAFVTLFDVVCLFLCVFVEYVWMWIWIWVGLFCVDDVFLYCLVVMLRALELLCLLWSFVIGSWNGETINAIMCMCQTDRIFVDMCLYIVWWWILSCCPITTNWLKSIIWPKTFTGLWSIWFLPQLSLYQLWHGCTLICDNLGDLSKYVVFSLVISCDLKSQSANYLSPPQPLSFPACLPFNKVYLL